ncbi:hypothetical protein, partial [Bradyrhizobium sp. 25ACV]
LDDCRERSSSISFGDLSHSFLHLMHGVITDTYHTIIVEAVSQVATLTHSGRRTFLTVYP